MKTSGTTKTAFEKFITPLNHFIRSVKNFVRASFLSLVVICIILLLLTQMDQAFTMLVDLMEGNRVSLFLSFLFINALAIALSHFPIYTYYAADLNNSGDYTDWHKVNPIKFWFLRKYPVFVFTTNKDTGYIPDNWANYLRYFIGILIHAVWIHFIISSFKPNLIFETFPFSAVKITVYLLILIPFVLYIYLKEKISKLSVETHPDGSKLEAIEKQRNEDTLASFYRRLGIWYFVIVIISLLLLLAVLTVGNFSPGGFVLLLLTSYSFLFNYFFFRLLRTKLSIVKKTLLSSSHIGFNVFIDSIRFFEKSENYILLFAVNFVIAFFFLLYCTLASINGWPLSNGIPILLGFFYFYYFIIANLGKYFFVAKRISLFGTTTYRILIATAFGLLLLIAITNLADIEVTIHELDLVENTKSEISEKVFIDSLQAKKDNTLFFIASHGGGLKANVWTLNVLNTLQQETEGKLLNQSIALSGASGGSLGLALYTGLYKEDGSNTQRIQNKIDTLAHENYTSLDLTLAFGLDSYRKLWPLNQRIGLRDRPYYAMLKYQNNIQNVKDSKLSETSFRDYWKEAFDRKGYFPSLIMNTAATNGSRGILWSVKQLNFNDIFPYSENLADLSNNKTIPFYQAVSTTNRFPMLSPAAKIPGYGHYIDAGAIDNSGLLGCLDLHNYLLRDQRVLADKQIAYIEIINSKTLYVNYLIEKFKRENKLTHIDKQEKEADNIMVDLETGLNLDKIPGYLSDYLTNWEKTSNGGVRYFKIFMPHKVTLDDIQSFFSGEISDKKIQEKLVDFLAVENNLILTLTEKPEKNFFDPWEFYEPTLSRHLSKSSVRYIKAILKHPLLREQFTEIEGLINTQKIEKNDNPKLTF